MKRTGFITDFNVYEYAKENNIYCNEAERVLVGEITLDEAKKIKKEFDSCFGIKSDQTKIDLNEAYEFCEKHKNDIN